MLLTCAVSVGTNHVGCYIRTVAQCRNPTCPRVCTAAATRTSTAIGAATGENADFIALDILCSRDDFAQINLDNADASSAFELVAGVFACDRRGFLKPIPGVQGLLAT
jgi:hypothetical protein